MIGIRVDWNEHIGMGHISRCLCVINELIKRNDDVCIITSEDTSLDIFSPDDCIKVITVKQSRYNQWNIECELSLFRQHNIKTLFIDSFFVTPDYLIETKKISKTIIIDDLYRFDYCVDAIVNYNMEATSKLYSKTKYDLRSVYCGVEYFPLRDSLKSSLRKNISSNVQNVLVTSGGTDESGYIDIILSALNPRKFPNITFQIIVGNFFSEQYKDFLSRKYEKYENIVFLPWGQDMKKLYLGTDILITPGSTMAYEALSLGVPCITYMTNETQEDECRVLDERKIALFAGECKGNSCFLSKMSDLFEKELSYDVRNMQKGLFSVLFDQQGVNRIADIVESYT